MRRRSAVLLLPSLLFLGAPARGEIVERIIAKVNGEIITQSEFQARQLAAAQAARIDPDKVGQFLRENNAKILQEAIDDLLLVQRADDAGLRLRPEYIKDVIESIKKENNLTTDEALQAQLVKEGMTLDDLKRNVEHSIVKRQILSRDVEGKISITDAEAQAEYDAKIADYTKPASVTLEEIYVKDEGALARAKDLVARARGGEDFPGLAKSFSAGPTAAKGGELGKIAKGDLTPALEKVAFSLPKGAVSDPIPSGEGFRILKVVDKSDTTVTPFEEAKADIKNRLMQDRWEKEYETYMADLRKKAIVELRVREVPLQLNGPVPEGTSLLEGTGLLGTRPLEPPAAPAGTAARPAAGAAAAPAPEDPNAEFTTTQTEAPPALKKDEENRPKKP